MNHPLADELFLVGHDEYTGKPTGNAGVLASALAGAVLGELLLDGRLTIVEGGVAVQAARAYGEKATDAVLGEVCRQGDRRPVRHWVGYLRGDVRDVVARRLVATGLVRREQPRGLARRGHTRYPAYDPQRYAEPRRRLAQALAGQGPMDAQLAALAALAGIAGLVPDPTRVRENLPWVLRDLVSGVDEAVSAQALAAAV
ncbi:GPP34 family phosphoprotein [Micromonospora sp. CPCC 205371]|nr:GPP34 family phosphoprotein [Micromonospora sp. CPCC 205371]